MNRQPIIYIIIRSQYFKQMQQWKKFFLTTCHQHVQSVGAWFWQSWSRHVLLSFQKLHTFHKCISYANPKKNTHTKRRAKKQKSKYKNNTKNDKLIEARFIIISETLYLPSRILQKQQNTLADFINKLLYFLKKHIYQNTYK